MQELGEIVKLLERDLGPAQTEPVPLDGGITNRNFRMRFGDRECVVRLAGRDTGLLGIDRDSERLAGEQAARLGIAPGLVAAGDGYLVTEYLDAAPVGPERLRGAPESVARALRAFHSSDLALPARFWVPELLDDYARIVAERGASLPADYALAQELAGLVAQSLPLELPVACHDDLLPANILATRAEPDRAFLVDWEYAGMGHPMFDLGNVAINHEFDEPAQDRLLEAYLGAPPSAGQRAALALMRIMSDAREAAWGVVQGAISELEFDFANYARHHFARLKRSAADPRFEGWLDAASP
jgi:thiamine kinase-like enzyme